MRTTSVPGAPGRGSRPRPAATADDHRYKGEAPSPERTLIGGAADGHTRDRVIPVSPACSIWTAAVGRTLREFVLVLTLTLTVLAVAESSEAVTLHPGDILVVDPECCGGQIAGIIRVNPADGSQTIVSVANNFNFPLGIAIAVNGDLLVADSTCCVGQLGGIIRVSLFDGSQ